jgi:hypothetical protein
VATFITMTIGVLSGSIEAPRWQEDASCKDVATVEIINSKNNFFFEVLGLRSPPRPHYFNQVPCQGGKQ